MSTNSLVEDNGLNQLTFVYPSTWTALRYDEENDLLNSFYKRRLKSATGMSAVDFIALDGNGGCLVLVECKDFRGCTNDNLPRFSDAPTDHEKQAAADLKNRKLNVKVTRKKPFIAEEFAKNVRDTLVGLMAAKRAKDAALTPFETPLAQGQRLTCVLALELDPPSSWQKGEIVRLLSRLKKRIEQELSYLDAVEVVIANSLAGAGAQPWSIHA